MSSEAEIDRMIVRLIGDSTSYMQMMKDSAAETKKAQSAIQQMGKSVEAIGAKIRSVGLSLSLAITAPLMGLGYLAQSEFTEFEAALSRMEGLVGIAGDEVARFRKEILTLAGPVAKSPVELAKAMEFITGSGIKGNAALETLTITAKAASAGLGETVEVANAVTSAMNAYGPANLSAAKATDILVATVREGKAEASSFAPVFGQILPLAAEMGIEFSEVGGALAFLTRTTGNASIASTQLSSLMGQLLKPTEKATKALGTMGITAVDISNSIKQEGIVATMQMLKVKLSEVGLEIKDMITDKEGLIGALQFTGPQAQIAADMIKSVGSAAGDTQKAFDAAAKTAKFSFGQAMAETKIILIELGEVIAPVMGQMISYTKMAMQAWKELSPETKQNLVIFAAIAATLGPVIVMLGTVVSSIGTLITAYRSLKAALGAINLAMLAAKASTIAFHLALTGGMAALAGAVIYQLTRMISKVEEFNESLKESAKLSAKLQSRFQQETGNILSQAGGMSGDQKTAFLSQELARAKQQIDSYKDHVKSAKDDLSKANMDPNRPMNWLLGDADVKLAQTNIAQAEERVKDAEARAQAIEAEMANTGKEKTAVELKPNKEKYDTKELKKYTEGLTAQLGALQSEAAVGKEAADTMEILKFKNEGASNAQLQLARDTHAAIAAQQKQNEINQSAKDLVTSLESEIQGLGLKYDATAEEIQLYQLSLKGANQETLQEAYSLSVQKKALQENKKLMEEGAALKKQHMDPAQKLREEQAKLSKMLEMGAIDLDTYNKALKEIQKQTKQDYKVEFKTSGTEAVAAGSAEAMERLREYQHAISGAGPLPSPQEGAAISAKTKGKKGKVENTAGLILSGHYEPMKTASTGSSTESSSGSPLPAIADGIKRLVALAEEKKAMGETVEFITSGLESV